MCHGKVIMKYEGGTKLTNNAPCLAAAAHRQAKEREEQQKRIQQAQQKQEEKENNREKMAEQHHQENVDLATKKNEINNRMLWATVRIGIATLIIAFIGMIFAALSFFKRCTSPLDTLSIPAHI